MLALALVVASILAAARANDWNTPCTTGSCGYVWVGDAGTKAHSSMILTGPDQVLSDVTEAAGWNILDCNPNWASGEHNVRMVCAGTPDQMAHCEHLFVNGGAAQTVVRLPENCGVGPFARVQKTYTPTNQSIPSNLKKLARRAGPTQPAVRGLTLDYNFTDIPVSRGELLLAISSSNQPVKPLTKSDLISLGKRGIVHPIVERGLFDFNDTQNSKLPPLKVDNDFTLLDTTLTACGDKASATAHLHIDVATHVEVNLEFGHTFVGSVIPPVLKDAAVFGRLDGDASATFNIQASVHGQFDSQPVPLFKAGLPGLFIPGIITLGPSFTLDSQLQMDLSLEAQMQVKAEFELPKIEMVFPESRGKSSGNAVSKKADNPLKLSAQANADLTGNVTAKLTPRGDFGIDVFNGAIKASVFLELELGATLGMEIHASANVSTSNSTAQNATAIGGGNSTTANNTTASEGGTTADNSTTTDSSASSGTATATDTNASSDPATATETSAPSDTSATTDTSASTDSAGATNASSDSAATATETSTSSDSATTDSSASSESSATETSSDPAATETSTTALNATETSPVPTATETSASSDPATTGQSAPDSAAPTSTDTSLLAPSGAVSARSLENRDASGSANGCVTLTGSLAINAGLEGTLKPLFDKSVRFSIFATSAQLFQKCFDTNSNNGTSAQNPRSVPASADATGAVGAQAVARRRPGGSTVARFHKYVVGPAVKPRRVRAIKSRADKPITQNSITPGTAKGSTNKLTCGSSPLSSLAGLI